jgi:hypothetical protein
MLPLDSWAPSVIAQTALYDSLYLIMPAVTAILCIPLLMSLFTFGGAAHNGMAVIASGCYLLLAGVLFYSPFLLPYGAGQNDVFMGNLLLSPLYMGAGLLVAVMGLLAAGRAGRGDRLVRALPLGLAGAAVLSVLYVLFGQRFLDAYGNASPPYLEPYMMGATIVLGIGVWIAGRIWQDRGREQVRGDNPHAAAQ